MPNPQGDLNSSIYQLARLRMRYEPLLPGRCNNKRIPMFTVKPANDTEEFYEVVDKYKSSQLNGTF